MSVSLLIVKGDNDVMDYREKYQKWLLSKIVDEDTKKELKKITSEKEIEDRFYKDLEFGTGGLRGIIGAGSNRMNIYSIGKATQGLAEYIRNNYQEGSRSASIAYDSRIMSREFAEHAAGVLCANGIVVNLFEDLRPTPMLSFAVGHLKSSAGIVITASHNPKEYNGYKVYGDDGGQITDEDAKKILSCIENIDDFEQVRHMSLEEAKSKGLLNVIGEEVDRVYFEKVKALSIRKELVKECAKDVKIIYTPIHGSGNIPVRRVLKELGYENVHVVSKQELPDGTFPTASYPNPENPSVFKLALEMAKDIQPDLIFGTDPDCDRIGVAVKDAKGQYQVLTGNQTGVILTHYILSSLQENGTLPSNGKVIKTIVTTEMARRVCRKFNTGMIDVLTGFKYIGEKIKEFKETGDSTYLFGFEESYGYLAGDFVRDKDAVIASMLVCEAALYYKKQGMSLYDAMIKLYDEHGYFKEDLVSLELTGREGQEKIEKGIQHLRHSMSDNIAGVKIIKKMDYKTGIEKDVVNITEKRIDLPKSNVLKFVFEDDSWFVVRPSGTEPKMKVYLSVAGNGLNDAASRMDEFKKNVMTVIDEALNY